jgi:ABC-type transport system substrate-binding protein
MKRFVFLFVICSLIIGHCAFADTKAYDGVWFLGFNMKKPIFNDANGKTVRQAIAIAIDREKIAKKIIGDDVVPVDIIPPGMEGHNASLEALPHNYKQAKDLLKAAGYSVSDPRIKKIRLLHTDGDKTVAIVNEIKRDLINLGFDITTTQIKYADNDKWNKALEGGKYDMFVMGYKAGTVGDIYIGDRTTEVFHTFTCFRGPTNEANTVYFAHYSEAIKAGFTPDDACNPQPEKDATTYELLRPLFYTGADANFTGYSSTRVDILLEEMSKLDESLRASRRDKLEELGNTLHEDLPVVPLFYITKL